MSSLHEGHANVRCIVLVLTDVTEITQGKWFGLNSKWHFSENSWQPLLHNVLTGADAILEQSACPMLPKRSGFRVYHLNLKLFEP